MDSSKLVTHPIVLESTVNETIQQQKSLQRNTQPSGVQSGSEITFTDPLSSFNQPVQDGELSDSGSEGEPKPKYGKKTRGRVRVKMQLISNKLRRYTTFSKRKTGIMKKAYELSTLTGTQVMLLVASETGHVYTFATKKLQPMITSESGKALIQTCLNSPETGLVTAREVENDRRMNPNGFEETELSYPVNEEEVDRSSEGLTGSAALLAASLTSNAANDVNVSAAVLSQNQSSAVSLSGATFNYNTIIPPTSNSDGTVSKATNLTMQVPQSNSMVVQGGPGQLLVTGSQQSARSAASQLEDDSDAQLQIQQQREQIRRLEQQQQEQQIQIQNHLQLQQQLREHEPTLSSQQVVQQVTNQSSPAALQMQQIVIPPPRSSSGGTGVPQTATVLQGANTAGGQVVYQTTPAQTLVYAPTAAIGSLDFPPFVNLVSAQSIQSLNGSASATPANGSATPQYITIPVSLASNQVLQQVMSNSIDGGKKT